MDSISTINFCSSSSTDPYSGLTKKELQNYLLQVLTSKQSERLITAQLFEENQRLSKEAFDVYGELSAQRNKNKELKSTVRKIQVDLDNLQAKLDKLERKNCEANRPHTTTRGIRKN